MKKLIYFVDCFRFHRWVGNTVVHSLVAAAHLAYGKAPPTTTAPIGGTTRVTLDEVMT